LRDDLDDAVERLLEVLRLADQRTDALEEADAVARADGARRLVGTRSPRSFPAGRRIGHDGTLSRPGRPKSNRPAPSGGPPPDDRVETARGGEERKERTGPQGAASFQALPPRLHGARPRGPRRG